MEENVDKGKSQSVSDTHELKGSDKETAKPQKVSIRFFNDKEVRAAWDEEGNRWLFSVVDVIAVLTESKNPRKYWSVLKTRLKKWLITGENQLDSKSRDKAYQLWDSSLLQTVEVGTARGLQQIHSFIFGGLYDFAGQIRQKNIAKGGFQFAISRFLGQTLKQIEQMPETTYDEIMDKYVEMNVAHPFMEGNGRSTRIWLDLMLKRSLRRCVDWSKIDKNEYLAAMRESVAESSHIKALVKPALTTKIDDREMFMKGIDYSYYYEQND